MTYLAAGHGEVRLSVRVQPRSSRNRVVGIHAGRLKIQLAAPPVEGAANQALVAVVADWLSVPKRTVRIVRGESAREKTVAVATDRPCELAQRIEAEVGRIGPEQGS